MKVDVTSINRFVFPLLLLLFVGLTTSLNAQTQSIQQAPGGIETLTVNVLDSYTENPVNNADVYLHRDGLFVEKRPTDAAGVVQFTVEISVGVEELPSKHAALFPAYPNPFIGRTSVPLSIDGFSRITATVYDLLGRRIAFLGEDLDSGSHEILVDLSGQAPGMYLLRLLEGEAVLGTTALINSGSGRSQTSASISIRSQVFGPISAPSLAAKTSSTHSIEFMLIINKEGYETGTYYVSMPEDKDFTALLNGPVISNSIGMEFIRIPAGEFEMGDIAGVGEAGEQPVHTVILTRDFYIGKYEVTVGEIVSILGAHPGYDTDYDRFPAHGLTWYDNIRYVNALSEAEGYAPCYDDNGNVIGGWGNPYECEGYRLPMEAEWEYAARGGTKTVYSWGVNFLEAGDYAWYSGNSGGRAHPVGEKLPNPWGLYDVHGNVWEWLWEGWGGSYRTSPLYDPIGGSSQGVYARERGGGWSSGSSDLRSANRGNLAYRNRTGSHQPRGIRLARTSFTKAGINHAPTQPMNPCPADYATEISRSPWLSWDVSDPDGDPLTFDMYIGTSDTPPLVSSDQGGMSFNTDELSENTLYYWYVVIKDGQGMSTTGPLWHFTTGEGAEEITNSIGMELIRIPAGTFEMGDISGAGFSDERPVHTVNITRDFYLGKYEVTQGEYVAIVGSNPSYFTGDDRLPVESLTWHDMVRFANALSVSEGLAPCYDNHGNVIGGEGNPYECEGYRLPMEAEWEYATRAGTSTKYSFGDSVSKLGCYGWYRSNSSSRTHVVGGKLPNPRGLYDVHGNVWEWVYDWYSSYSSSPSSDPIGPSFGSRRVIRGGGRYDIAHYLRSAIRGFKGPAGHGRFIGFRLARTAQ